MYTIVFSLLMCSQLSEECWLWCGMRGCSMPHNAQPDSELTFLALGWASVVPNPNLTFHCLLWLTDLHRSFRLWSFVWTIYWFSSALGSEPTVIAWLIETAISGKILCRAQTLVDCDLNRCATVVHQMSVTIDGSTSIGALVQGRHYLLCSSSLYLPPCNMIICPLFTHSLATLY